MMKKAIAKIRAPRGFFFKITPCYENMKVSLFKKLSKDTKLLKAKSVEAGHITLSKISKETFATHSWLAPEYRSKGLGTLMYARAIQWCLENGYKARSSGGSSYDAQRVWNGSGIRKFFTLRKRIQAGYGTPTWYAYPR